MEYDAKIIDKKLIINGYLYLTSKCVNGKKYWDCKKVRRKECMARAITADGIEGAVIVLKGPRESEHSHAPNQEECKAAIFMQRVKRMAEEHPEQPPAQILRTEMSQLTVSVLSQLPERQNMKRAMRRGRRRNLPPNPKHINELKELPNLYTKTLAGDRFLVYDSMENPDDEVNGRVLVFATRNNLELLARSPVWFLDGTFKVCPTIFTQVFTILGLVKANSVPEDTILEAAVPLVYALLTSKDTQQYVTVLRAADTAAKRYLTKNFYPQRIMLDFEKAIINACAQMYPDTVISCCVFHLGQSVYRHVQNENLQVAYNDPNNREVKLNIHMLLALAYIPPQDVITAFNEVKNQAPKELKPILEYFAEVYIMEKPARGRRKAVAPRFPVEMWNQHATALSGQHKTNNISEGWHNRFRLVVGKHHPDLYSALAEFRKEQADTEIVIAEIALGRKVKAAPKKKWLNLQNQIKMICIDYYTFKAEGRTIEYLNRLAHLIVLN